MFLLTVLLACSRAPLSTETETGLPGGDTAPGGDTGESGPDYSEQIEEIRQTLLREVQGGHGSGASLAIWRDGRLLYAGGVGMRHPTTNEEVTATTLFQIGSDTKKLTAIQLLRQVEAGRLTLDDPLTQAIPALSFASDPDLAAAIDLRQLLTHRSGLYDYTPWEHRPDDGALASTAYGVFAENEYSLAPPGGAHLYSNPNYSLIGLASEIADGRAWATQIEEDIFAPLGMDRSIVRLADVAADGDFATGVGYANIGEPVGFHPFDSGVEWRLGTIEMADQIDDAFVRPAGLVWSTAADMVKLGVFLLDGDTDVLSDALRQELSVSRVGSLPALDASIQGYGYGLVILSQGFYTPDGWHATPYWMHGGNTLGMTSDFVVLPEQRLVFSILSNGYMDSYPDTLSAILTTFGDLPAPSTAPDIYGTIQPPTELAGTWQDPHGLGIVHLSVAGENLMAEATDFVAAGHTVGSEVSSWAEDCWQWKIDGAWQDLYVIRDEAGIPRYLTSRLFALERVDNALVPPRPPIRPPPSRPLPPLPSRPRPVRSGF